MGDAAKVKWGIDQAHSEIGFKIKHLVVANIRGVFKEYEASIYTTGEDFLTAEVDLWINPASVDTRNDQRDGHLKSADFFDVAQFHEISIQGNSYEKLANDGHYDAWVDVTMKGVKKQVKMQVEFGGIVKDAWGVEKAIVHVEGKIERFDWGLNWNSPLENGGMVLSNDVSVYADLQLIRVPVK